MPVNGLHMIPNKHAAYSRGVERQSTMEGRAVVLPTLKGSWLLVVLWWRKQNFILAEELFVSMRNRNRNSISVLKKCPTTVRT